MTCVDAAPASGVLPPTSPVASRVNSSTPPSSVGLGVDAELSGAGAPESAATLPPPAVTGAAASRAESLPSLTKLSLTGLDTSSVPGLEADGCSSDLPTPSVRPPPHASPSKESLADSVLAPSSSACGSAAPEDACADPGVARLLALLSASEREQTPPDAAARFLRATNGDAAASAKRLQETLRWRESHRPERLFCTACAAAPASHYMSLAALDRRGRPTIYSSLAVARCRDLEPNRTHMVACFESAIAAMPEGVEDWVWVLDMHGFGLRDCDPRLALAFCRLSAAHYPERLAQAYIVSAPAVFSAFWKGIHPLIDPKTREKIRFLSFGKKAQLRQELARSFDPETVDWFEREMEENRSSKRAAKKAYPVRDLLRLAAARTPDQRAACAEAAARRRRASLSGSHDLLGTRAFQEHVAGNPAALSPGMRLCEQHHERHGRHAD